jgi:hypothetical protein
MLRSLLLLSAFLLARPAGAINCFSLVSPRLWMERNVFRVDIQVHPLELLLTRVGMQSLIYRISGLPQDRPVVGVVFDVTLYLSPQRLQDVLRHWAHAAETPE